MYQLWYKEDFGEGWTKSDFPTLEAARQELKADLQRGKTPLLTKEIGYEFDLKIREGDVVPEKTKSKPKTEKTEEPKGEQPSETKEDTP